MLYDNVKELAGDRGLSIAALERKAKLSNGTIGKWKDSNPTIESVANVAFALGVSVDTLLMNRKCEQKDD